MNEVVFMIGASSGIGLATAQKLCDEGCVVYCGARSVCPDERVSSIILDAVKPQTVTSAVQKIVAETGKLNTLVYCAGCSMAAPVEFAQEQDYRYLFEVNFFGAVTAIREVLPQMREAGGGKIILVGSMGGVLPIAYDAFYSASKAALCMLGKELSLEVKPLGINVTTVLPGGTATRFTFKRKVYSTDKVGLYGNDMLKSVGSLAGMEQGGDSPDDVADTVIKAMKTPNPPCVVASGAKNKAFYLSQKLLPDKLTQRIVSNSYNLS